MRTIKFRGIIKSPDELFDGLVYGDLIHYANGGVTIRQQETGQEFEVEPETVGQFTGLFDKNGKEIFEGDVLKCIYYKHAEKNLHLIQKVVFSHSSFFVVTNNEEHNLKSDTYCSCPLCWVDKCEIIGNIFDNPELLKN